MKKLLLILSASLFQSAALAKELDSVTPPSSDVPAMSGPSPVDGILRVSTSFGPASLSVDSVNYKVGGATDILAEYKIGAGFMGTKALWATFRYLPFGSAAEVEGYEYEGVMNGIFFGASADIALPIPSWSAFASAEIGGFLPSFDSVETLETSEEPTDFASGIMLGGGALYHLNDKFAFGPKLNVGAGSFTSWQLGLNASFAF